MHEERAAADANVSACENMCHNGGGFGSSLCFEGNIVQCLPSGISDLKFDEVESGVGIENA